MDIVPSLERDWLRNFTATVELKNEHERYCPICKGRKPATKQDLISKAPEVLILHLKRSEYSKIRIDSQIDLSHYMSHQPSQNFMDSEQPPQLSGFKYSLFSIVTHEMKDASTGHFKALCKNKDFKNIDLSYNEIGSLFDFPNLVESLCQEESVKAREAWLNEGIKTNFDLRGVRLSFYSIILINIV